MTDRRVMFCDVLLADDFTDIAGAMDDAKASLLAKGFDLREFDVQIRLRHLTDVERTRKLALELDGVIKPGQATAPTPPREP